MKRLQSRYILEPPARRPLKIFAVDPMLGTTFGNRVTVSIANESLQPGPQGERIAVIDYDGPHDRYYPPVNLDDPAILMQGGLDPTESDPRFHQQMVYAVAMKTLENFERALGRRLQFSRARERRLRIFPHAFFGSNAFYDRELKAILFGYFRADRADPGQNMPGQIVFACLSHDIIAHEMTHAVVDRLRQHFLEPSNVDVLAFHEGFSDIVALFQHFSFEELLRDQIQKTRSDLHTPTLLVDLARQFGYATGSGRALRSALGTPNAVLSESVTEPHERGSILVAAVFDGFYATYQRRIADLVRIATGGTGKLPEGDLHPDLVSRVASEASRTAQQILTMCIRAFDYLPPVDITFGDYLRALVTADYELVPDDQFRLRAAMIEAFRMRGIYPQGVPSLAEESLVWEDADQLPPLPRTVAAFEELVFAASAFGRGWAQESDEWKERDRGGDEWLPRKALVAKLLDYAKANAPGLHLDKTRSIALLGFHPVFRTAPDGQLLIELVVQFGQRDVTNERDLGGLVLRGGTTLVASANGRVRYLIVKPLPSSSGPEVKRREGRNRLERQLAYTALCASTDGYLCYGDHNYPPKHMTLRTNIASLHRGALS